MIKIQRMFVYLGLINVGLVSTLSQAFPVHQLQSEINQALQQGRRPVAVVDIDETMLRSTHRKVASYRAAIARGYAKFAMKYPSETAILNNGSEQKLLQIMNDLPNVLDSKAWLGKLGIQNESFHLEIDAAMLPIYLSEEFMLMDRAYQGAQALLDQFYRAGGEVYFVSSRYRTKQYDGTIQRLLNSKLYRNAKQSHIVLREDGESSLDFKVRAFQQIRQSTQDYSKVVMVAENEPENMNAMMSAFPQALPVFVVGAILNTSVSVNPNARLIKTKTWLAGLQELR